MSASLLLGAAGNHGDGQLVVGVGNVAPINVVAGGVIAIVKLGVSVINVFALAFEGQRAFIVFEVVERHVGVIS